MVTVHPKTCVTLPYIDCPLYFVHPYNAEASPEFERDPDTLAEYYLPLSRASATGVYALWCQVGLATATAVVNGAARALPCDPELAITQIIRVDSTTPEAGTVVLDPQRFVFGWDGTCNVASACT